jgi:caffeoyl-CoA O-methyltransferase
MFSTISEGMAARMRQLERMQDEEVAQIGRRYDARAWLRQVPPETGRFLAILAATAPSGTWLEIGTSGGYSAMWISLACRARRTRLITIDHDVKKVEFATETFRLAGIQDIVEVHHEACADRLAHHGANELAFCFIDAGGGVGTYDDVVPKLVPGGILVYDNAISHAERARPTIERALADDRVDAVVVPIGSGQLVCRRAEVRP